MGMGNTDPSRPRRSPGGKTWRLAALALAGLAGSGGLEALRAQEPTAPAGGGGTAVARAATAAAAIDGLTLSDTLPIDPAVRIGTLPNGLRYYVRQNARPEDRAELRLVVNAGSVLEDEDQRGLAHVVEHMAFNGTERFEKRALVDWLESLGVEFGPHANAHTGFDETVYSLEVPTDSAGILDTAIDVLRDWAGAITFDPDEIENERAVVLEERRLGLGAAERLNQRQLPVLLRGSRYAERLPIGTRESLETFGRDELVRFYEDWYRPDLMAVVVVGDFDPDRIESLVRQSFAGLERRQDPRPREVPEVPEHQETLVQVATDPEATATFVEIYRKRARRTLRTVGDYRRSVVQGLFEAMLGTRLDEITTRPDAPFVAADVDEGGFLRGTDAGWLAAQAHPGGATVAIEALATEARRVGEHGFTAGELERAKANRLRGIEMWYDEREKEESSVYVAEYVDHFLEGDAIPGTEVEYELHRRLLPGIGLADLGPYADGWAGTANRVVLVSAPAVSRSASTTGEKGSGEPALPAEGDLAKVLARVAKASVAPYVDEAVDRPLVAEAPAPGRIVSESEMPGIGVVVWELSNGVRVLLKPTDFKDDEVLLEAWSPGGSSLVPEETWRATWAVEGVVERGGVGDFDLVALTRALTGKAVDVSPSIREMGEGMSGYASPRDLETMFQLVWLWFTRPNADEEAFRAYRQQAASVIENRDADPWTVFEDTVFLTMSGGHPRALPASRELVDALDLDASIAVYRDRFADASDFTFAIVGSFAPDSIRPLVGRWLGSLPDLGRAESWRDLDMDPPPGIVRKTVRRGLEPRAHTDIVFQGPFEYTPEARRALHALADVLDIRLRELLREELGGTYSVEVTASASRWPDRTYELWISFGSDPDRTDELTATVFRELETLRADGPTPEEALKVRERARLAREEGLKDNGWWVANLLSQERIGEDPRDLASFRWIDATDADMIRNAARSWLTVDDRYLLFRLLPEAEAGAPEHERN